MAILLAQLVLLWGLGLYQIPSILERAPQQFGNSSLQHSYEPNCLHLDLLHLDLLLLLLLLMLLLAAADGMLLLLLMLLLLMRY